MTNHIDLADPPARYRPIPFWSWNEKLDPEELRRQVREMAAAGLGGFFMHARGGLQTVYLSEEWMACVEASLDEAEKCGIGGWLYDENGWPSGFGGGVVNGLGVRYQQKYLRHEVIDAADAESEEKVNTIAFYSVDGSVFYGPRLDPAVTGPVLRCYFEVNPYYVDNLDRKVVQEFLRVTHKHYYDRLPERLRKALKGIFTDEPQLSRQGLLWSFALEEEYWRSYHRELLPELPMLFLGTAESRAMRIRFWSLCARLFNDSFMKQIRDWCDAHGWMLTGHHVLEETCQGQISSNGSVMTQYQHYHIPGMDHLCRTEPSPVAMTQLISVAAQCGQKQILSESFALCGWNFNFYGMCWMFQQQLAHGVNLCCQHLESYSLRGLRKRDYPGSNFLHQPWWGDYKRVNDYFARVGMVLAEGSQPVRVLVIHPLSSAWAHYTGDNSNSALSFYSETLRETTRALDALQVPHHYADEVITADRGSVEDGKFKIGAASYDLVIVPQIGNLSTRMRDLLFAFARQSGVVLRVRNRLEPGVPTIDGERADAETAAWWNSLCAFDSEEAAAEIAADILRRECVRITEHGIPVRRMVSTFRDVTLDGREGRFYFIANLQYNQPCSATLALPRTGRQVEWIDPESGAFSLLSGVRRVDEHLVFDYPFAAGDAAMFFVSGHPGRHERKIRPTDPFEPPARLRLPARFRAQGTPNLLTLDRCRFRVDGDGWTADDVSVIQARLLKLKRDCKLEIEYPFTIGEGFDFSAPPELIAETPEKFRWNLNGIPFEAVDLGPAFDIAFRRIALPGAALRPGVNRIGCETVFHQSPEIYEALERAKKFETEYNKLSFDTEIESVYLAGNFTVRHTGRVEPLLREAVRLHGGFELQAPQGERELDASDLTTAGYPFFAGKITLRQEFELSADQAETIRLLRFRPVGANSFRIRINGEEAGMIWRGFPAVPIDRLIHAGTNHLEIELTTSLRNLLGPHHLAEGESYAVNTLSFNREPNAIGRPAPAYNPGYCFVKLGVDGIELA